MAVGEIRRGEINAHFLIYIIFGGDKDRALRVSREYSQVSFQLTPKAIERALILELIDAELSDDEIVQHLSTEDNTILKSRIKSLRKVKSEKRSSNNK